MHGKIIFCTIVWVLSLFVWGWFCSFFRDSRECTTKWHIFWSDMSLNPIKTSCYISTIPMDKAHLNILRKIYYFWALSLVWPIWLPAAIILSWWNFHKNTYFGSQMIWASLWRCLYASTILMDDAHIALYCVSDFFWVLSPIYKQLGQLPTIFTCSYFILNIFALLGSQMRWVLLVKLYFPTSYLAIDNSNAW